MGAGTGVLVDYAYFVNYGTSKQRPRFFMEKAVNEALKKEDTIARQIVKSFKKNL